MPTKPRLGYYIIWHFTGESVSSQLKLKGQDRSKNQFHATRVEQTISSLALIALAYSRIAFGRIEY